MTDLEINRLCAAAMGGWVVVNGIVYRAGEFDADGHRPEYNPLHDDAQAMALVKKFRLNMGHLSKGWCKVFTAPFERGIYEGEAQDLNRAICECVAKMQKAK